MMAAPHRASFPRGREARGKPRRLRRWINACAGMTVWLGMVPGTILPALAQQAGWHYSPLPGEGDRAAMGCTYASTPEQHACLVVRCEDDFSVGLHLQTSRPEGDAGSWVLEFDREMQRFPVAASADGSPYGARIEGDVEELLFNLRNAGLVYLEPQGGSPIDRAISLSGSLDAITQALYFCAPKAPDDPAPDQATR